MTTGLDLAQEFWKLLLPTGLAGGALAHVSSGAAGHGQDEDGDERMDGSGAQEEGWKEEHTQWWFDFLEQSGTKGVSKDVWQMVSPVLWFLFLFLRFGSGHRGACERVR